MNIGRPPSPRFHIWPTTLSGRLHRTFGAVLIVAACIFAGIYGWTRYSDLQHDSRDAVLRTVTQDWLSTLPLPQAGKTGVLPEPSYHAPSLKRLRELHIVDRSGRVLSAWAAQGATFEPHAEPVRLTKQLPGKPMRAGSWLSNEGFWVVLPIATDVFPGSIVAVRYQPIDALARAARSAFTVFALALMPLGLLLVISRRLFDRALRPVRMLTEAMRAVDSGKVPEALDLPPAGEFGELVQAFRDNVLSLHRSHTRMLQLAYVDSVTGLGNRELFRKELDRATAQCKTRGAIFYIDLDQFKLVNDTFGHDRGDHLLWIFAERLKQRFDLSDVTAMIGDVGKPASSTSHVLAARIGGDEFAILLPGINDPQGVDQTAQVLLATLNEPFDIDGIDIRLSGSVGVALYPQHGRHFGELLRHADIAMYAAKAGRQGSYRVFDASLEQGLSATATFDSVLRQALANGEFELYYQPKVACGRNTVVGAEALIRWNHPSCGLISPTNFIAKAEENGMIVELGDWAVREACQQIREWQVAGCAIPVSVNASIMQLERADFANSVRDAIQDAGIEPMLLEIEISESMAAADPEMLTQRLQTLKDCGVRLSIDDFGTGHSSLSRMCRLPFDTLKIDQSFISGIGRSRDAEIVIKTVLAMAANMNCETVAEGIETEEQYEFLTQNGCTLGQGYLFAKPLRVNEFRDYVDASAQAAGPASALRQELEKRLREGGLASAVGGTPDGADLAGSQVKHLTQRN